MILEVMLPDYNEFGSGLHYAQVKAFEIDKRPTTQNEIVTAGKWSTTHDGDSFLLLDKHVSAGRILVYGSERALSRVCDFEAMLGDGTFYSCPKMFSQMYSLHGILPPKRADETALCIPILYAFLPNKEESTYVIFFELLLGIMLRIAGSIATNLKFKFDFEVAAINAARYVFPSAIIHGCFFHYCQCLNKNKDQKGLKSLCYSGSDVQRHIKMLASLALLPIDMISDGFLEVMADSANDPAVIQFNDYFVAQWMENPAIGFSWSCAGETHRTTNFIESWHHRVNTVH